MQNVIIDEEFKGLLPELDVETYALLEENILQNGCRDSLVLWGEILVDGHNRYEICTKHDIAFNTINKDFSSREEALIWIVSTQISRRNLSPLQLSHYRGLHYRADKKMWGGSHQDIPEESKYHNDTLKKSTAGRLAEKYKVSRITIMRDAKVAEAIDAIGDVSPEAKRKVLSGEVPIEKKVLQELSTKPKDEITAIAEMIEDGSYVKEKPQVAASAGSQEHISGPSATVANSTTLIADRDIDRITDEFFAELSRYRKEGNAAGAKAALRSYIDRLEDLYKRLP